MTLLRSRRVTMPPLRCQKVFKAFRWETEGKRDADARIKDLVRMRTLEELAKTQTTVYALCKRLGLNLGNVYAFLNKGENDKLSRENALKLARGLGLIS